MPRRERLVAGVATDSRSCTWTSPLSTAREHNLPAYVIFHDATLAEIARRRPASLDDLQGISGIGAKKLEAYGADVLRVVTDGA